MDYTSFLETKRIKASQTGFVAKNINEKLFPFQKKIVSDALFHGKYAIFADCGMGKTAMQLEWAKQVHEYTKQPVIILAPLAVSVQTQEEGMKFGIEVNIAKEQKECINGVNITNYERLHKFEAHSFSGIVLDESSILKSMEGKTRMQLVKDFQNTKYKLCCTATPSPNDFVELGNHCEFLNIMNMNEMLSLYFINDIMGKSSSEAQGWRLKGHAEDQFWRFVGSWSTMLQKPSDIGNFDDAGYNLPEISIHQHIINSGEWGDTLFAMPASTLTERRDARKSSLKERVQKTKDIILSMGDKQCLVWCDYNNEADELAEQIDCVEVRGSDTSEKKENSMLDFAHGKIKTFVSKPSICGWGMNWQNCDTMIFCGISDSYEQYYQAIRRCWRFGQKNTVQVHVILSDREISILENIQRKQANHQKMFKKMAENINSTHSTNHIMNHNTNEVIEKEFTAKLGDCVERIKEIESDSIGFSIFSPPFASLYTYTNSERDMGNCKTDEEFYNHFSFLITELYRVLKPGRILAFHCMNLPTSKSKDGFIGIKDFRGMLIKMFQDAGWIYHSEVCIWKDPVVAMQRTKALGLLHKQIKKDSSMSRQGLPDYVVAMRKPGENTDPISHTSEEFPVDEWQKIASPVWMDIKQSNTLQRLSAREEKDEKHICPLQLDVIDRCLYLWSNPGDTVLSPFMGIGSEGYCSLRLGRKFVGIELKESYFKQAIKNLENAQMQKKQPTLF